MAEKDNKIGSAVAWMISSFPVISDHSLTDERALGMKRWILLCDRPILDTSSMEMIIFRMCEFVFRKLILILQARLIGFVQRDPIVERRIPLEIKHGILRFHVRSYSLYSQKKSSKLVG